MNVALTIPSFAVHGGIRIILEWANRLAENHSVTLRLLNPSFPRHWFPIDPRIRVTDNDFFIRNCDLLIITSPHAAHYLDPSLSSLRTVIFLQMMEHLFRPGDKTWHAACEKLYRADRPMILISNWNQAILHDDFGRLNSTHYVGNGINFDHFPVDPASGWEVSPQKTVLIEGSRGCKNPTKDPACIAPLVARRLKQAGYRIVGYGARSPVRYSGVFHKFHVCPDFATLNRIYSEATILLKASRYDARALAPLEAMTKGVPTARAIIQGDDDLIDGENCLRCDYNEDALYRCADNLLKDDALRAQLSDNCRDYVQREASWTNWWPKIEQILADDRER